MGDPFQRAPPRFVGRYGIYGRIASGGMATVYYGRLFGTGGFARTVAVKRLHRIYASSPEFVAMFLDEAQIASRIRHPNVVATLDALATDGELFIVMDYVAGEALSRLVFPEDRVSPEAVPVQIACTILAGVLRGLHAAHKATSDRGAPLNVVHRDVSPQNIVVGADGTSRILDFGIAKARESLHATHSGVVRGKIAYMAPEQLDGAKLDRRCDVYACGIVLWEALTGRHLFEKEDTSLARRRRAKIVKPSAYVPTLPRAVEDVVMRALEVDRNHRFASALEMTAALELAAGVASPSEIRAWLVGIAGPTLDARAAEVAAIEGGAQSSEDVDPADEQADRDSIASDPSTTEPTERRPVTSPWLFTRSYTVAGVVVALAAASAAVLALAALVVMLRGLEQRSRGRASVETAQASTQDRAPAEQTSVQAPIEAPRPTADEVSEVVLDAAPSPAAHPHSAALRASCVPPYTVDARGVRHIKPGCVR